MITALLTVLSGDMQKVTMLLSDDTLPEEAGIEAARQIARNMSDQDLQSAIALFERLRDDHRALERWLGYGDRLAEERGHRSHSEEHEE